MPQEHTGASIAPEHVTVLAGPTAVGKGTVSTYIRDHCPEVWLSVSATFGIVVLAGPISRAVPGPGWLRLGIGVTPVQSSRDEAGDQSRAPWGVRPESSCVIIQRAMSAAPALIPPAGFVLSLVIGGTATT